MDIEVLRKICLEFPAVTEDIKWGNDLVFSIWNAESNSIITIPREE